MVLHSHDRMREGRVLQREENKEKEEGSLGREGGRVGSGAKSHFTNCISDDDYDDRLIGCRARAEG